MTTKDLFKERMTIRKSDPVRASVLGMLIDAVQKALFDSKKEETEADIRAAAKKMYEQTLNTIQEYKKGNGDTSELEQELAILKPFLPQMLSAEQTEAEIKKVIDSLADGDKTLKNIMPKLKSISGIDMKSAKAVVEKLLQAK